jgi:hypothetical protein
MLTTVRQGDLGEAFALAGHGSPFWSCRRRLTAVVPRRSRASLTTAAASMRPGLSAAEVNRRGSTSGLGRPADENGRRELGRLDELDG